MADYAGALAAIKARLVANWTATRITYQNETPAEPWPPVDGAGNLAPFVNLEVVGTGSELVGQGVPGDHVWRYDGFIYVHVFTPVGTGPDLAHQHAVTIGEIYRAKTFYGDVTSGCYVRSWAPRNDGGGSGDDDGLWFRVTMSCPFEYWHRG